MKSLANLLFVYPLLGGACMVVSYLVAAVLSGALDPIHWHWLSIITFFLGGPALAIWVSKK